MRYAYVLLAACLCSLSSSAHAYSDPAMFSATTADGGGGGRWFTGSAADGYTCNVCHDGGAPSPLTIEGLPIDGYQPGASYEVIVDWPDALLHVGVNAEITDERGLSAGTIALPEGPTLDAQEQCLPYGAGIPATFMNAPNAARAVMTVADCGARRLRFLWTAPTNAQGQLWLSGAVVIADGMGDVHGDGVTDFARPIAIMGQAPVASTVGGCAISHAMGSQAPRHRDVLCALLGLAVLWQRRARRTRPHVLERR